ncbi:hypothetical protein DE146DRAFT_750667 [Phaeosphaeria sp. MPI-PUGE-AT-0046c]|nr:hypothetical protein DE146DRAFT_750667 [Phaeosphaeria sp. MPI-PUGE-AT-0046c]
MSRDEMVTVDLNEPRSDAQGIPQQHIIRRATTATDGAVNNDITTQVAATANLIQQDHVQEPQLPRFKDSKAWYEPIVDWIVDSPLIGFLAFIPTYVGALNIGAYWEPSPLDTADLRHTVNPVWGPGWFFTWLLSVNTLMYDVYYYEPNGPASRRPLFDKARLFGIVGYGGMAICEQIYRAAKKDFGPDEAVARYISDKAFESLSIIVVTHICQIYLRRRAGTLPSTHQDTSRYESYAKVFWIPFIMLFAFGFGRALVHGHECYVIPHTKTEAYFSWTAPIPYEYRPLSFVGGLALGFLSVPGTFKERLLNGFPCLVWSSLFLLHCGLFGTLTPFSLTSVDPWSRDQLIPFVLAAFTVVYQYREDIWNLPRALAGRVVNVVKWKSD